MISLHHQTLLVKLTNTHRLLNSLQLCNSERFSYQRTVFAFIAYRVFVQYFQESEGSSIAD